MTLFADTLRYGLSALDLAIDGSVLQALEAHWRLVKEYNQKSNLTAIKDDAEAALKHYLDSLLLLPLAREALLAGRAAASTPARAADIGSGAGYPGLVLALAYPQSNWLLLEANRKKCGFLRLCLEELAIKNADALPLRAEDAGRESALRGQLQLVTARAVAALPVLLEYALPLLAPGGTFLAAKGPAFPAEEAAAARAIAILGAAPAQRREFVLPGGEQRLIASYQKQAPTPAAYPRRAGMPDKRPLGG